MKYNPRSYLEFEGAKVNTAIRQTILNQTTNEFALFNNGITMLSDDTNINEKIGQKYKAQLIVRNPQIINGGQTAFTLSKILEENADEKHNDIFNGKEVLLKIITLLDNGDNSEVKTLKKIQLIDDVSTATNQQTAIIPADRFANESYHVVLQRKIFNSYGILFERKRGEFADGINQGYLDPSNIVERNLFFRIIYASQGKINKAADKKLFQSYDLSSDLPNNVSQLDDFYFSFLCFRKIHAPNAFLSRKSRQLYGQIYVMTKLYKPFEKNEFKNVIDEKYPEFLNIWNQFLETTSTQSNKFNKTYIDKETKAVHTTFSLHRWFTSPDFESDVLKYFKNISTLEPSKR